MRRRQLLLALLAVVPPALIAQGPPAFDVVSIKPNRTNQGLPLVVFQPGGRIVAANVAVRQVILIAYGLEDIQLVDAPDWTRSERFAIEARAADQTSNDLVRQMLRSMLADRFGFAAHRERRELPIYALTMARPDKQIGSRLRPSGADCAPIQPPPGVPMPPPPPPPPAGAGGPMRLIFAVDEPPRRRCGAMITPGWLTARSIAMREFARVLTQLLRRPVVDETGLGGDFDLDLLFAPEDAGGVLVGPPPAAVADAPSLFTALQEDLGLKLDSRRGPVDVLVVDKIERPSEN
jgi:uncharacterized protein (TIGR03435 family)